MASTEVAALEASLRREEAMHMWLSAVLVACEVNIGAIRGALESNAAQRQRGLDTRWGQPEPPAREGAA